MNFIAYNSSTSAFIKIKVESVEQLPDYFWDSHLIGSDDEFQNWAIWRVENPIRIKVLTKYKVE